MNKNIIALDFDDCILPSDQNYFGTTDDSLILLEINCKRIKMIIEKYDMQIFITSAWVSILKLVGNNIEFKNGYLNKKYPYEWEENAFKIISKYLNGYFVGFTECGNKNCRKRSIRELLAKGHNVVVVDDMDLSDLDIMHDNCLFLYVHGFVGNEVGYKLKNFLGENDE